MIGTWHLRTAKSYSDSKYSLKGIAYRAYSIMKDDKIVGQMMRNRSGWSVHIHGFSFHYVENLRGVLTKGYPYSAGSFEYRSCVKDMRAILFQTASEARAAIRQVFKQLDRIQTMHDLRLYGEHIYQPADLRELPFLKEEIAEWCNNNIKGKHHYGFSIQDGPNILFEKVEDLILFKMRWL